MKSYGDGWYVWHWDWGTRATYTIIPDELEIVYENDDEHETIRLVLCKHGYDDYELGEDEHVLDDIEEDMEWRHRMNETDDKSEEEESDEDEDDDMYSD